MFVNRVLTSTALLLAIIAIGICVLQPIQTANAWQAWSYSYPNPPWYGPHPDLASYAATKTGFTDWGYIYTIRTGSVEPDLWGQLPVDHAYFVDAPNSPWNAAWHAQDAANRARTAYLQNNKPTAYDELGHGLHYMSDISMPYHTSASAASILYHNAYENYAGMDNWDHGQNIGAAVNSRNPYPPSVTNPDEIYGMGISLAYASYSYVGPITSRILYEPDYWYNDPVVTGWTVDTYTNGMCADMSLFNYVKRGY